MSDNIKYEQPWPKVIENTVTVHASSNYVHYATLIEYRLALAEAATELARKYFGHDSEIGFSGRYSYVSEQWETELKSVREQVKK